jgi:tRNA (guanine-N7-)-methyltransferase
VTDPFSSLGAKAPAKPFTATPGERRIRSFVLRQGRFTPAQQRAFDALWPRFGLDYTGVVRDFDAVFGRHAQRVLEIGFGNGEALRFAAQHDRGRDYIGIEVHAPGVGRLLNALAEDGSDHVRIYHHDAVEVLTHEFADGSADTSGPDSSRPDSSGPASSGLDEIRIYFPDPWHKKRHNKRRLVNPAFAALLARKLRPGGRLHLATDWHDYAEQMWDVLDATPGLRNTAGPRGHVPRPPWRPQTHFESRGQRLGHDVWDLLYLRDGGLGIGDSESPDRVESSDFTNPESPNPNPTA